MKQYNSIRSHLMHLKDKIPMEEKAGLVYLIQCGDCNAKYVSETKRKLNKRIKEHHKPSSPVGHHIQYNDHTFEKDNVKVLQLESDWFRRGVAEAIHIETEKPTLNRDRGRHTLPVIYREIVKSRDPSWSSDSTNNIQS